MTAHHCAVKHGLCACAERTVPVSAVAKGRAWSCRSRNWWILHFGRASPASTVLLLCSWHCGICFVHRRSLACSVPGMRSAWHTPGILSGVLSGSMYRCGMKTVPLVRQGFYA
jgi:hypothetical protein